MAPKKEPVPDALSYRLGSGQAGREDAAGPSTSRENGAGRKFKFMPTNFRRKTKSASSSSTAPVESKSAPSEGDGVFEGLIQAAAAEGASRGGFRGRGRGPGRILPGRGSTIFGGRGFGDGGSGGAASGRLRVWGGHGSGGRGSGASVKSDPRAPHADSNAKDSSMVEERREPEPRVFADAEWDETRYRPLTLPLPPLAPEEGGAAARSDPGGPLRETQWLRHAEANDGRVVLLQLPSQLPFFVGARGAAGGGLSGGDGSRRALDPLSDPDALVDAKSARLGQLGAGRLGKLLVFESGAVRLQIEGSEVLFDVQPGVPVAHRHEVAVMAPASKQAVLLGGAKQRLVATPHLESLLSKEPLPNWERLPPPPTVEEETVSALAGTVVKMEIDDDACSPRSEAALKRRAIIDD